MKINNKSGAEYKSTQENDVGDSYIAMNYHIVGGILLWLNLVRIMIVVLSVDIDRQLYLVLVHIMKVLRS